MKNVISPAVLARLEDRTLYDAKMSPPPAEKLEHVAQFELTTGCSYGGCGFCTMHKDQAFRVKTPEEFIRHVNGYWDRLESTLEGRETISNLKRVFIGGGNALAAETKLLTGAIDYVVGTFKEHVGRLPSRVAMYGNTRDILSKGERELMLLESDLKILNCGGICGCCSVDRHGKKIGLGLLYWGLESGSSDALKFADKGYTKEDAIEAGQILRSEEVNASAMIISGLGGMRLYDQHVMDTLEVINGTEPKFLTFLGIDADETTRYGKKMAYEQQAGINRPLSKGELIGQMADIIGGIKVKTIVGCHGPEVHRFGYNPTSFGSVKVGRRSFSKNRLVSRLRKEAMSSDFYQS